MSDYLCLTLLANPGEDEAAFKVRLAVFWTYMLRNRPNDYEKVYAEATRFAVMDGRLSRQYLVETDAIVGLTSELSASRIALAPVDLDDIYTKYEAASPDWFQLEH
jgi:hypothetical protein